VFGSAPAYVCLGERTAGLAVIVLTPQGNRPENLLLFVKLGVMMND